MLTYNFASTNLLDTSLTSADSSTTSYKTKTTLGFLGRKTTSLVAITPDKKQQRVMGGIDWRGNILAIEGQSWNLNELKTRVSGMNSSRIWHWLGRNYQVTLHDKQWIVIKYPSSLSIAAAHKLDSPKKDTSFAPAPIITLSQGVQRLFKSSTLPSLQFHNMTNISEMDITFFLLVVIYSEIDWQDEQISGPSKEEATD